jgi:hypothetical protein
MTLTVTDLGAIFLLLFGLFHFLKIFATVRAVLVFLGVVVIGSTGFIGRILADVGSWAQHVFGDVLNWAIGVPLAAGLFIIIGVILVHDLHPKNSASSRTGWLAVAAGVLVVVGVTGVPALAGLRGGVIDVMSSAVSTINSA